MQLDLNTLIYDALDMSALKRALDVQLPLIEQLGVVRASIIGLHTYLFAIESNCAAIDRAILLLAQERAAWPEALQAEVLRCAEMRAKSQSIERWADVYRSEAAHILVVAAESSPGIASDTLRRYQIYACAHLLGQSERPDFFTTDQIDALLEPQTDSVASLFARQFAQRQRKPELLRRELSYHFAELNGEENPDADHDKSSIIKL